MNCSSDLDDLCLPPITSFINDVLEHSSFVRCMGLELEIVNSLHSCFGGGQWRVRYGLFAATALVHLVPNRLNFRVKKVRSMKKIITTLRSFLGMHEPEMCRCNVTHREITYCLCCDAALCWVCGLLEQPDLHYKGYTLDGGRVCNSVRCFKYFLGYEDLVVKPWKDKIDEDEALSERARKVRIWTGKNYDYKGPQNPRLDRRIVSEFCDDRAEADRDLQFQAAEHGCRAVYFVQYREGRYRDGKRYGGYTAEGYI